MGFRVILAAAKEAANDANESIIHLDPAYAEGRMTADSKMCSAKDRLLHQILTTSVYHEIKFRDHQS